MWEEPAWLRKGSCSPLCCICSLALSSVNGRAGGEADTSPILVLWPLLGPVGSCGSHSCEHLGLALAPFALSLSPGVLLPHQLLDFLTLPSLVFLSPWITTPVPLCSRARPVQKVGDWPLGSDAPGLWFGETTSLRQWFPGFNVSKGSLWGLWNLSPHTGPIVPDSLQAPGKTHQVLGLPSLACPWHWEFLMSGARATDRAPLLLLGKGGSGFRAQPGGMNEGYRNVGM